MVLENMRRLRGGKARGKRGSPRGEKTRREILSKALQIAAREGLAALTIGRLAQALGMSKSGLFAHFRSKRALELATIHTAREVFANAVLLPATSAAEGIERLWKLCDSWLQHIEQSVLPGSYFFSGAFFAYAERPGAIAQEITGIAEEWLQALERAVQDAKKRQEIDPDAEAKRIAFELNAILIGAHWAYLLEDDEAFAEARATILRGLRGLATSRIPASAFESLKAWKGYLEEKHS
jgi:AcrR family transcriptional regulator